MHALGSGDQGGQLTCSHKEDASTEDDVVLAAVEPPGADAEPAEQQQDGAEDGEDAGGTHDAWVGQESSRDGGEAPALLGMAASPEAPGPSPDFEDSHQAPETRGRGPGLRGLPPDAKQPLAISAQALLRVSLGVGHTSASQKRRGPLGGTREAIVTAMKTLRHLPFGRHLMAH